MLALNEVEVGDPPAARGFHLAQTSSADDAAHRNEMRGGARQVFLRQSRKVSIEMARQQMAREAPSIGRQPVYEMRTDCLST